MYFSALKGTYNTDHFSKEMDPQKSLDMLMLTGMVILLTPNPQLGTCFELVVLLWHYHIVK